MDTEVDRPVLLDNTVLANFALAGRADLVMRLWQHMEAQEGAPPAEWLRGKDNLSPGSLGLLTMTAYYPG